MKKFKQINGIFAGLILSTSVVPVVTADDIEIYTTTGAAASASKPNIMFIIDGSLDMLATSSVTVAYDPATKYAGDCDASHVYYSSDPSDIPDCSGLTTTKTNDDPDYFNLSALACKNALVTTEIIYDTDGITPIGTKDVDGPLLSLGLFSGRLAYYESVTKGKTTTTQWAPVDVTTTAERSYTVDCEYDMGSHGEVIGSANVYIDNASKYVSVDPGAHAVWSDNDTIMTLFSANYVNYKNSTGLATTSESYFDQIREAIEYVVDGNTQVNIAMMVLDQKATGAKDPGSEGGGILYQMQDGSSPRGNFIPQMWALNAEGATPLSEAYYEALLYYGGKSVDYGSDANPPTVGAATEPGNTQYTTPIQLSCSKNYIVVASNGKAKEDDLNATRQSVLGADGFATGRCSDTITPNDDSDDNLNALASDSSTDDNCLDELAYWAANNDVAELPIDAHDGEQTIITHTVGFGYDAGSAEQKAGQQLLEDAADKGNGEFYRADSKEAIKAAFDNIILNAIKVNSTFSSPAVSVNAFNRSTHLDNLFFTLFKPTDGNRWDGNLKKYKLQFAVDTADRDGDGDTTERYPFIADQLGNPAVDPTTGFFSDTSSSYWTTGVDGKEVADGGAANKLTTTRNVYTFTGTYTAGGAPAAGGGALTSAANAIDPTNAALTDAMLDITAETAGGIEMVAGTSYRDTLINWAAGLDALSDHGAVDTYTDVRPEMGDPLHAEPALVQYGEVAGVADLVAFTATNDGYLHAIDIDDGTELWSFVPQELLPNLKIAMEDDGGDKLYGLDGNVVAWINDANGDGTITKADGDHVYLYVTMRRGGNNIYAIDVTTRTAPGLLWVIKGGTGSYTELGQSWSSVNIAKVKDGAIEKTVLIFGGGYDEDQDNATVTTEDDVGRTVYIADATTGARLWTAGADAATPMANMDFSIPARIKPLDISGDGYIDRLYAADMGGQIFRFDINNTNGLSLANSVIGGRIADLADASTAVSSRTAANARRFFYPPDVALINAADGPYHSLIISSGYRAHPLDTTIQDRIYMIKDRNTDAITSSSDYKTLAESNLHNATANLAGGDATSDAVRDAEVANLTSKEGWYIYLDDEDNPGSWLGEKGLAEPLIIEGMAVVTTYTPDVAPSTASCEPSIGLGKIFFLDVVDATPAFPSSLDSRGERHTKLVRGGIPPSPNVIITEGGVPTLCVGTECDEADFGLGVRKTYWYEVN